MLSGAGRSWAILYQQQDARTLTAATWPWLCIQTLTTGGDAAAAPIIQGPSGVQGAPSATAVCIIWCIKAQWHQSPVHEAQFAQAEHHCVSTQYISRAHQHSMLYELAQQMYPSAVCTLLLYTKAGRAAVCL